LSDENEIDLVRWKRTRRSFWSQWCGHLVLSAQMTPLFTSKQTTPASGSTDGRGCQIFLRFVGADQIW